LTISIIGRTLEDPGGIRRILFSDTGRLTSVPVIGKKRYGGILWKNLVEHQVAGQSLCREIKGRAMADPALISGRR
jgi:hypothetical protein